MSDRELDVGQQMLRARGLTEADLNGPEPPKKAVPPSQPPQGGLGCGPYVLVAGFTACIGVFFYMASESFQAWVHEPAAITPADLIFKQITVTGFWLSQWFTDASDEDKQALFGQLVPLVASGQLTLAVDSIYPLDQVAEAVGRSMGGRRTGKVLLHPNA